MPVQRFTYRQAVEGDIPKLQVIRNAVRENVLSDPARVADADYAEHFRQPGNGWVCTKGARILGFAIADRTTSSVWALFVHPLYEGRGIGSSLLQQLLSWYFSGSALPLRLSTAPGTRAERFYRMQGWKECGHRNGEVVFEMALPEVPKHDQPHSDI